MNSLNKKQKYVAHVHELQIFLTSNKEIKPVLSDASCEQAKQKQKFAAHVHELQSVFKKSLFAAAVNRKVRVILF